MSKNIIGEKDGKKYEKKTQKRGGETISIHQNDKIAQYRIERPSVMTGDLKMFSHSKCNLKSQSFSIDQLRRYFAYTYILIKPT